MATPEWAVGLDFQCIGCGATYPSLWARDMCQMEHDEDDRDTRRR